MNETTPIEAPAGVPVAEARPKLRIETLLEECVRRGASDLHIQAKKAPLLRVNGELVGVAGMKILEEEEVSEMVFQTMSEEQKKLLLKDKEIDYSFAFGSMGRFRANAYYETGQIAAAFRLIPDKIQTIEELGLPPIVETFANYPRGLVLVTGPTGSGKSTTIAALVDKINSEKAVHIVTIEDPIEFTYAQKRALVSQREVHHDTYSFTSALRSVLRQDPDVVVIGEMRDLETISAAIMIAETGHLVFATLHTNSAAQSVDRIVDVFPAEQQQQIKTQLAAVLMSAVSQRLVPRIGGGRIAAAEIMVANTAVKTLIREGKSYQIDTAIQTGADQGMQTMDATLAKMVKSGVVTYESGRDMAVNLEDYERMARG